jgi:hypothetical protein
MFDLVNVAQLSSEGLVLIFFGASALAALAIGVAMFAANRMRDDDNDYDPWDPDGFA